MWSNDVSIICIQIFMSLTKLIWNIVLLFCLSIIYHLIFTELYIVLGYLLYYNLSVECCLLGRWVKNIEGSQSYDIVILTVA